ncbi:MAG TPA: Ig-like domain-containing protein [Gemmatimonadaceae bacterium]|nr:Ig-like domain-containing protein [Gemmatimonadaceae bacterium]
MPHRVRRSFVHGLATALARLVAALAIIATTATCDGANVLGPVGVADLELEWLSDTLLFVESRVAPVIRVTSSGAPVAEPRVILSSENPEILAVSTAGDSLHARRLGTTEVTIRVLGSLFPEEGESWRRTLRVVLKDLQLDRPAVALTSVGDTATIHAVPLGADDRIIDVPVEWRSLDTNKVAVASGRLTARGTGSTEILAIVATDTARATVTVEQRLAAFVLSPEAVTLRAIGAEVTITATAVDASGAPVSGVTPFWESGDASVARVDASGRVTAIGSGITMIYAFKGPVRSGARVEVINDPATIAIDPSADTLTRAGQQLSYTADVRNAQGVPIPNYPTVWRSDNPAVAVVSSTGTVTAMAPGVARIIGEAGTIADTVRLVIRDLTVHHVDNASSAVPRIGTRTRPFASIQTALADITSGDTIALSPGNRPYAESPVLAGQISIIGNDSAYLANGSNPAFLPVLSHESGTAAVSIAAGSSVLIRNIAIRHVVDGPAVSADGAGIRLENVHVNPGETSRVGRGFRIANATGPVITNSRVTAVVGYGILLANVSTGLVSRVQVSGVDSVAGANGEGIRVVGGFGNVIELSAVRATIGPRILLDSTSGARVDGDTLSGRHRLLRVHAATGATVIANNVFSLDQQSTDPPSGGSAADGRAALEIIESGGVTVSGSSFTETAGNAMDAIRLTDARGAGVAISASRFTGGRYHIRSARSTWSLSGSVLESAVRSVTAEDADTIAMTSDTLRNGAGRGCVDVRGASSLSVVNGWLATCTSATADTGMAAITVDGVGAALAIRGTRFTGANETAIALTGATLTVQNVTLSGAGTQTVPVIRWPASITAVASSADVTGSSIVDYRSLDGASLRAGSVRFEGNRVWRQRRGLEIAQWLTASVANNDFADHAVAAIVNGEPALLTAQPNWWGDGRGPRRATALDAVGDSVIGAVDFAAPAVAPHFPGAALSEDSLRIVRGNNQSALRGTALPQRLTVRVMDQQGRPVAGVSVRFRILSGGGNLEGSTQVDRVSNASGLSEAQMTLGPTAGSVSVEAAFGNGIKRRVVTFTLTSQ